MNVHNPSVRGLWSLAFPLILSSLTGHLMLVTDRIILGHYSMDAMNASVVAGTFAFVFTFGFLAITSMAEVFVGQLNGEGKKTQLAEPVWQMIWLTIPVGIILFIVGYFCADFCVPEHLRLHGNPYFQYLMYFGFLLPLNGALTSFFIGQGLSRTVLLGSIVGNALNIALDYIFIFGMEPFIEPMGAKGAAIASVLGLGANVLFFAFIFFNKHNRKSFNTLNCRLNLRLLWDCLRIGTPNAVSHGLEIAAWGGIFYMVSQVSELHMSVMSLTQCVFIMVAFFCEGLSKGVIAMSSNLIGAGRGDLISQCLVSGIKIAVMLWGIAAIPFLIFPDACAVLFTGRDWIQSQADLFFYIKTAFFLMWLYVLFELFTWSIAGILSGAGDTKAIMVINALSAWFFGAIPCYYFVYKGSASPSFAVGLFTFYGVINFCLFLLRYKSGAWRKIQIKTPVANGL